MFYNKTTPRGLPTLHTDLHHAATSTRAAGLEVPLSRVCHAPRCVAAATGEHVGVLQDRWNDTVAQLSLGADRSRRHKLSAQWDPREAMSLSIAKLNPTTDPLMLATYRDAVLAAPRLAKLGVDTAGGPPRPDFAGLLSEYVELIATRERRPIDKQSRSLTPRADGYLLGVANRTGETATVTTTWPGAWHMRPGTLYGYTAGSWDKFSAGDVRLHEALCLMSNGILPLDGPTQVRLGTGLALATQMSFQPKVSVSFDGPVGQALESLCGQPGHKAWAYSPVRPTPDNVEHVHTLWDAALAVAP